MSSIATRISNGVLAALSAAVGPIANTETQVLAYTIPANTLKAGDRFRIVASGYHTNATDASTGVYRARFGPTTLIGVIASAVSYIFGTTGRTDAGFAVTLDFRVKTIGAGGTAKGAATVRQSVTANQGIQVTADVTIDTTVDNLIELTFISGHANTNETFEFASIEKVG